MDPLLEFFVDPDKTGIKKSEESGTFVFGSLIRFGTVNFIMLL